MLLIEVNFKGLTIKIGYILKEKASINYCFI